MNDKGGVLHDLFGQAGEDGVARFYDDLAAHYHLLFDDWERSLRRQGQVLDRLIAKLVGEGAREILDAACGIGTQTLGLALKGHRLRGTDLSAVAIARARREAARLGLDIPFSVADMRMLSGYVAGPFDLVIAVDNALPHLSSEAELTQALGELRGLIRPGGWFLASIRDYDKVALARPRSSEPRVIDDAGGRRVVFQVWDWRNDGSGYRLQQYIVSSRDGLAEARVFSTDYHALTRRDLDRALAAAGFTGPPRWLDPPESDFYQPIVMAQA